MPPHSHARTVGGEAAPGVASSKVPAAIRLTLPARPENVGLVRHVLDALARTLQIERGRVEDVRLAVTEACTNVVRHAYLGLPEGPLEVVLRPRPDRLEVVVSDFGRGLGPTHDASGPGLGLPLVATLADELDVQQAPSAGTRLAMSFRLHDDAHGAEGA